MYLQNEQSGKEGNAAIFAIRQAGAAASAHGGLCVCRRRCSRGGLSAAGLADGENTRSVPAQHSVPSPTRGMGSPGRSSPGETRQNFKTVKP